MLTSFAKSHLFETSQGPEKVKPSTCCCCMEDLTLRDGKEGLVVLRCFGFDYSHNDGGLSESCPLILE